VHTTGSDFDTLLAVYTGAGLGELALVDGNDDFPPGRTSSVHFDAEAGTEYRIAVDGYGGAAGWVELHVDQLTNDAFADAHVLEGAALTHTAHNYGASREPGEPRHAAKDGEGSVWFRWTAPADGLVELDTADSSFDTLLAVYTGESLEALELVAEDDDSGPAQTSRVTFPATAGVDYRIAVAGYQTAAGAIVLALRLAPPA
jgi:hypothetical protein